MRVRAAREQRHLSTGTAYGERPPSPFAGLPVSELAIFAGMIGVIAGWLGNALPALLTGVVVCFLGVLELTAREHFSGYRSHSTLLAAMAAVAVETLIGLLVPPHTRVFLVIVMVPVFGVTFMLLRRRFTVARQARVRAYPGA